MIDRFRRGFSLIELMVTLVVLAVVASAVMEAVATSHKTQRGREMLTRVQGESRAALTRLEEDLRSAALGASGGVIWGESTPAVMAIDPNPVAKRPAVQIFDNVPGGADFLPLKPGTDAVLVVSALRGSDDTFPATLVSGRTYYDATQPFDVTEVGPLANGAAFVLAGGADSTFAPVASVSGSAGPGQVRLALSTPAAFPDGKLKQGSSVRVASAHLYYVDAQERLVRVSLPAPRLPMTGDEASDLVILGEGIENLQVDCEMDASEWLGPCPEAMTAGSSIGASSVLNAQVEEAKPAGMAGATGGPRMTDRNVKLLRIVDVMVVARSLQPVLDGRGDDPIAIGNQIALLPVTNPKDRYTRRVYRMSVGVRNTSLGAF